MRRDYAVSQGRLLKDVADIQMRRGICFALSGEWCLSMIHGREFNVQAQLFRMVARHRAYKLTWETQVRKMTGGGQYAQFFQTAEPPSYKFMADQAQHENVNCERDVVRPVDISKQLSAAMGADKAFLLGFFGVRRNSNWGHATAFGWQKKARYFDPNLGQFSWAEGTDAKTITQNILEYVINRVYALHTIRDFVIYHLG